MKLDAGTEPLFCAVNRPTAAAEWERSVEGLRAMKDLELQSMFFEGEPQNTDPGCVDDWIAAVKKIRPNTVQIYTIDRPPADPRVRPASRETLDRIADRLFERTGIRGSVS
jgi:wyosine [tRNA(Phe)-imidazoG37] synthetase (radical SAM superfamily)